MEIIKIREKTDTEIMFSSVEELVKFYSEVSNGKGVVFEYVDPKCREGEYIEPGIFNLITDNKIRLKSKEER